VLHFRVLRFATLSKGRKVTTMIELSEPGRGKPSATARQVAHELRKPLPAAFCALRTIERTSFPAAEVEHARLLVEGQLRRLARIVDDLVDVASQRVELSKVVRCALDACQHSINASNH
jgi:signal transduction histidine kinase